MSLITAKFVQGFQESRRYLLDMTLDLATGESIASIASPVITSPSGSTVPIVVSNIVLAPAVNGVVNQATFFVSGGAAGQNYEIDFLVTTSLPQVIEVVAAFNIVSKT